MTTCTKCGDAGARVFSEFDCWLDNEHIGITLCGQTVHPASRMRLCHECALAALVAAVSELARKDGVELAVVSIAGNPTPTSDKT